MASGPRQVKARHGIAVGSERLGNASQLCASGVHAVKVADVGKALHLVGPYGRKFL